MDINELAYAMVKVKNLGQAPTPCNLYMPDPIHCPRVYILELMINSSVSRQSLQCIVFVQ